MHPLEQASAWVCESGGRPPCRVRSPLVLHLRARRSTSRTGPARPPPARCANPQRPRCTRRSLFCCCGMREARCYSVHARKVCPIHHSNRLTRLFFRTQVSCQRYYSDSAFGGTSGRTMILPLFMNFASRCMRPFTFLMPSMDTGVGGLPPRPAIGHCGRWPVLQRTAVHARPIQGDIRCGSAARRPAWRPACRRPRRRRRGRRGRAGRSEKPGFFLAPASRPLFFRHIPA